jgi:tRNA(Arg) A34 adenosine deaminase TadA
MASMNASAKRVVWELPAWVETELDWTAPLRTDEEKMQLAIDVARLNIDRGGGPFGAIVVDGETGALLSVGANWVVPQRSSLLHAEIAAIAFAQLALETYSLASRPYELIASSEPCIQCLGATVWSGVTRLVCGAGVAAAEAIGFDEGPRRDDWVSQLETRGIQVRLGVLASEAGAVLAEFGKRGKPAYAVTRKL